MDQNPYQPPTHEGESSPPGVLSNLIMVVARLIDYLTVAIESTVNVIIGAIMLSLVLAAFSSLLWILLGWIF